MPRLSAVIHRRTFVNSAARILASALLLTLVAHARSHPREHWGEGFSITLDEPYQRVLQVVQETADDGIIRGTFEYADRSQLEGAESQKESTAFRKWTQGGVILYKTRARTISPSHFYGSNDQGMVTVRYIVQELGPKSTSLRIDAIFVEESLHNSHPSDGTPENAEFLAISDRIKDLNDRDALSRQEAASQQATANLTALQAQLDEERSQLSASRQKVQELESQVKGGANQEAAYVRRPNAELKTSPYNASRTLQSLPLGTALTVLSRSANWYRVQAADGQQGWIYRLMVEVTP